MTPFPTSPTGLNMGTTATFGMVTTGTFPYYCTAHVAQNMAGVVFVVP